MYLKSSVCTPPNIQKLVPSFTVCGGLLPGLAAILEKLIQRTLPPPRVESPTVQMIPSILGCHDLDPHPDQDPDLDPNECVTVPVSPSFSSLQDARGRAFPRFGGPWSRLPVSRKSGPKQS